MRWLHEGIDSEEARRAAEARKVEVTPFSVYSPSDAAARIADGFAAVNAKEIKRGVHQLAIVLEDLARAHP